MRNSTQIVKLVLYQSSIYVIQAYKFHLLYEHINMQVCEVQGAFGLRFLMSSFNPMQMKGAEYINLSKS